MLLLGVCVSFAGAVWPQPSDLSLSQLNHRMFTATDGAPSDIVALAQTPNGTLWIGGRTGLTRFDGVRFVPYPGRSEEPLESTNIATLLAASDGGLWIGFRPAGVSLLKGGHVTRYGLEDGLPNGTVQQLAEDRDGSIWAVARLGLARFSGQRWETVAGEPKLVTPYGVVVDRAGTLWVGTVDGLLARPAGEGRFRELDGRVYSDPGGSSLTVAPDGRVWAAATDELVRVDRPMDPRPDGVVALGGTVGAPLLFDADGNLWASDGNEKSLLRLRARDMLGEGQGEALAHPERLSRIDASISGRVYALLEDRERNVWVGTTAGLHRFSHTNVVRDGAPPCLQFGFAAAAFAAGEAGALWVACDDGSEARIDEIRDGAVVSREITSAFTVAYRDPEGTVWFAGPQELGHLVEGRVVTAPLPPSLLGRPVQALLRDGNGAMWVSVSRRGTFRLVDGEWSENGGLDALPRDSAYVEIADMDGALWLGYTGSRIARVNGRAVEIFDRTHGLDVGNVLSILAHDREIWVGGELGFARFDGARFVSIRNKSGEPFKGVSGIVKGRNGDLWLNGIAGIVHVDRKEVDRVLEYPDHRIESETFDYLDGVPGAAIQLRPQPSAIETTDGRIWFSTTGGIISIDATQLVRNALPPPVTIWSLSSGRERYPNVGEQLHLPVHTTDLQIEYSAGSLTVPERVRFRYKLEGSDRFWQEVGDRREARYTNLRPGRYTFRVTATNNDGVWNDTGAAVDFTIAPAFYQTRWFYALWALAAAAILTGLYRMRMSQVAAQVRGRLEARLAERERIARELHDTLLQGIQGLIWRFQAATDRIPAAEPARAEMERSLDRADQMLAESRDKVKDLRPPPSDAADLAQALAAEGEQLAQGHSAAFRVSVQGAGRALHPMVREEGFLIAREALSNAFRHAGAGTIEAEVGYAKAALHVRIRDDGQGIGAAVLDAGGTPGHFGLIGMRERAKKLGAHLDVWSKPGAGTEVDLRVPANVAYGRRRPAASGVWSWLAALRSTARDP
ncbi:MAG TPA: two-component regulator propeller domain-containing protein [Gammaproteobacteria bacterium]|nr:two-component regulator propeller domain-containing protein [Gammaproteobacteria bacterium]